MNFMCLFFLCIYIVKLQIIELNMNIVFSAQKNVDLLFVPERPCLDGGKFMLRNQDRCNAKKNIKLRFLTQIFFYKFSKPNFWVIIIILYFLRHYAMCKVQNMSIFGQKNLQQRCKKKKLVARTLRCGGHKSF